MLKCIRACLNSHALVVQWIELPRPKGLMLVRFRPGAPSEYLELGARRNATARGGAGHVRSSKRCWPPNGTFVLATLMVAGRRQSCRATLLVATEGVCSNKRPRPQTIGNQIFWCSPQRDGAEAGPGKFAAANYAGHQKDRFALITKDEASILGNK